MRGRRKGSAVCMFLGLFIAGCSGTMPPDLGAKNGRFVPCPASPNCVSSQSTDKEHAVEPLAYSTSTAEARADLYKIIVQMPRAKIVDETDAYIHAEFRSAVFRFVDDAEFYFDEKDKLIEVRSAARVGYSDFGVNRKRVEMIRAAWKALRK